MPTLVDLTPLLSVARYAATAYAVIATVLTTACLTLHFVTRIDRVALRRRASRTGRGGRPAAERPLFLPLEQAPAAS
jgi:hypothetical protein